MRGRKWTEAEDAILRRYYSTEQTLDVAARLRRSVRSVYTRAGQLGLKKPEAFRSVAGKAGSRHPKSVATRFMKGQIPANKGQRMPEAVYAKCAPTMFQKGQMPHNHKPVGTERLQKDGYVYVKVAEPKEWRLKHRMLWEETFGPIPRGCNVQFRNGNRQDMRIENLYLIGRAEQLRKENCAEARYPEEVRIVIRARGLLKRQITLHDKKQRR